MAAYLAGPAGVGKTHLLLATCAAADAAGRRAAYLPLVAAAGRLRDALEALEGNDLLALDGLEAIAGNRDDEVALFDAHNRARAAGISLLYAARDSPGRARARAARPALATGAVHAHHAGAARR